ncbi:MAG: ABC transporter ATP-binding protein [Pseudomonadota bacterium]|nr:ABC transporter ATP-binding protein [Pseudomonadota bacterium]
MESVKEKTIDITTGTQLSLLKWFWRQYLQRFLTLLLLALIFMTIEGSMIGLLSYSVKSLFDDVLFAESLQNIYLVGVVIFSIFSVRALSGLIQRLLVASVAQKVAKNLQSDLVSHLLSLDMEFFFKNAPGLLIERVRVDTQKIVEMGATVVMTLGRDGVSLFSLVAVAVYIDWKWALIAFIGAPLLIFPVLILQNWIRKIALRSRNADADNTTRLDEIFHGVKSIKLNEMEKIEWKRLDAILNRARRLKYKMESGMSGMPALIDLVAAFGFLAVMIFGASEIVSGEKSVGEFMSFFTAMALLFEPLRRLSNISGSAQVAIASIDKVHVIFNEVPKIVNSNVAISVAGLSKTLDIKFQDVSCSYGAQEVLSGINLHCEPGKITAIVGASGAGKTTLINMIPRLIDPTKGKLLIGDVDVRLINLRELRSLISIVSQENSLFDDTVLANIVMGQSSYSQSKLEEVLADSFVSEFLSNLDEGLNYRVGPRGEHLSGGQRQRVLIARALLRDKPILILDEPTSALDSKSEKMVEAALRRLSAGRTTIVVAHRISTIVNAEKISVLKSGQIVEHGTHQDLLLRGNYYPELVKSQLIEKNGSK